MEPVRWRRLRQLFELAEALEPADLSTFLDRECGQDVELRRPDAQRIAPEDVFVRSNDFNVERVGHKGIDS